MKTIFSNKNRGKFIPVYIVFAIAVLSFFAFIFYARFLPEGLDILILIITLIVIMFLGSLIIDKRNGPPW
jgi:hypothetical protein